MITTVKVMREVEIVDKITCNKCGEQCANNVCLSLTTTWGYHSHKDGDRHKSHVCEKCYDEFVATFIIPVEIEEGHIWE